MQNYSQNNEQEIIINYFAGRVGTLLDIGANDGVKYSNTYAMCRFLGWRGVFVEPSAAAFEKLLNNYNDMPAERIMLRNYGISDTTGLRTFSDSGSFDHQGGDVALLSTLHASERARWGNRVSYTEVQANFISWPDLVRDMQDQGITKVDFVTVDAEGEDYQIFQKMEYLPFGVDCICIEHNGKNDLMAGYREVARRMGLARELGCNAENLIFGR